MNNNKDIDPVLINNIIARSKNYAKNPAICIGVKEYNYEYLIGHAVSVAKALIDSDVQKEPVAVWCSGKFTAYSGILGILMASNTYLPLNPKFPGQRNNQIFKRSRARAIVLNHHDLDEVNNVFEDDMEKPLLIVDEGIPSNEHKVNGYKIKFVKNDGCAEIPEIKSSQEDMAYLMFTSGSTGIPKGVPVSNRNVTAYLRNILDKIEFHQRDRFSQMFDLTFDLSVHDLFVCWISGACLCVPEEQSSLRISKYIKHEKISVWFSVPSQAVLLKRMRLLKENAFPKLRVSLFCGEPLPVELADSWQNAAPASEIWNLYGPTETTIAITSCKYGSSDHDKKSKNGIVSIGRVFSGHEKEFLNQHNGKGILALSGEQVVEGYYYDPENTEKAFYNKVNKRWYSTGDLVAEDEDGDLFFLGREDNEVKIGGYRVNLLEIENHLHDITGCSSVVVGKLDQDSSVKRLIAFIEDSEEKMRPENIMNDMQKRLPWYMLPAEIRMISKMPLNSNLKIDRKELMEWAAKG